MGIYPMQKPVTRSPALPGQTRPTCGEAKLSTHKWSRYESGRTTIGELIEQLLINQL